MTDRTCPDTVETAPAQAEGRWLWRRSFVYAASLGLGLILMRLTERADPGDLPMLVRAVTGLMALMAVLYLVGPTAQQLITLMAQLPLAKAMTGQKGDTSS